MSPRGTAFHVIRLTSVTLAAICALLAVGTALPADAATGPPERSDIRVVAPESSTVRFSSFVEDGRRFTSVSTDGGASWSEPRPMMDRIFLLAGPIVPGESAPALPKNLAAGDELRVFIVQLETQSLAEWRRQLAALGAEVLTWVPYDTHLVRMDRGLVTDVEALPFVRWVGPYEPAYRTFPQLLDGLHEGNPLARRYRLMTYTAGPAEKALLAGEVAAAGGRVVLANPEGYVLEADLTDGQVVRLLASNHVQWIDFWTPGVVDMNNGRVVSGADFVASAPGGYDGTGVRAEVFDTFVDTDHPDFPNPVPIHGPVDPDSTSHGTSCYGINFGSGAGNASATGMAPGAFGYFAYYQAVFYGGVSRYAHTAELVNPSLEYQCVYQSNSVGHTRTTEYTSYSHEMDDIIWQSDFTIFQSQSNAGDQDSRPEAWAKNIVSVGGAYHSNNTNPSDDSWSFGASIGPAADGRIKPDLTFFYDSIFTTADGGGYRSDFGGTSGATPMVAGTSALFFQMWADNLWGTEPGSGTVFEERPHFTTVKALLINTANQYDWTLGGNNVDLLRVRQGWGHPDAQNAYDRAALTHVIDETSVLQVLESDVYTAVVPAAQDALRVTMVFADRAGNPGSLPHRINDVTLKVTSPTGTEYWGNTGLAAGVWSTPGGAADTLNTVENVFIQAPEAGDWTIEVIASEVNMDVHAETPEDDQDYALVVSGATALRSDGPLFADGFESGTSGAWSLAIP